MPTSARPKTRRRARRFSGREKAEEEVLEIKDALQNAFEGIACIDEQGAYIFVNEAYAAMVRRKPAEMLGRPWHLAISVDERATMEKAYQEMSENGKSEIDIKLWSRQGGAWWVHVVLVKGKGGRGGGHVYCFARDTMSPNIARAQLREVTSGLKKRMANRRANADREARELVIANDRLKTEIERANLAAKELERKRRELSDFVENATIGMHWVGSDGCILWANHAELELLGYRREEYVGHNFAEFHADKNVVHALLAKMKSGETLRDREVALRGKDGSVKHVLIDSNVFTLDGEFLYTRCFTRDITARKLAEAALKATEDRIRTITEAASDTITTIDESSTILFVNKASEKIFGYTPAELVGKSLTMLMPGELRPLHQRALERYLQSGERHLSWERIELTGLHKDGRVVPVEVSFGESGTNGPRLFTGIIRDIAERKATEARVKTQYEISRIIAEGQSLEALLPEVLRTTCEGLGWQVGLAWRLNPQTEAMRCVAAWSDARPHLQQFVSESQRHARSRQDSLLGQVWTSREAAWVHAEKHAASFRDAAAAGKAGLRVVLALPVLVENDVEILFEFLTEEARELDLRVFSVLKSVCGQIGLFIEQKRAEEALRESEERFRLLVEGVKDHAMFMLDRNGHVTSWNAGAQRTLGYDAAGILGKHFSCFYTPEDIARGRPEQCLKTAESEGPSCVEEGERYRKDGSRIWAEVVTTALRDQAGRLRGFSEILRDITDQKRAKEALAAQMREISRSNEDLQQFAFCASHDLQEPLRKIQAFGDRLWTRFSAALTDEARDYLDRMKSAASRMQCLIDNLLTYSRITTKGQPFAATDLNEVVQEVLSDLEVRIEEAHARLEVQPLPTLQADRWQMRQLLQNLISNALKFRKPDVQPVIELSASMDHATCCITVKDNGIGFDPKYTERIFNLFQRLHGQDQYAGTGIGLATCRKIAERHGGTIAATSSPGQGATFTVTLPASKENPNEAISCSAKNN